MLIWPENNQVVIIPTNDGIFEAYKCMLCRFGIKPIHVKELYPDFDITQYASIEDAAMKIHTRDYLTIIADNTQYSVDTDVRGANISSNNIDDKRPMYMTTDMIYIDWYSNERRFRGKVHGISTDGSIIGIIPDGINSIFNIGNYSIAMYSSIGVVMIKLMKSLVDSTHLNTINPVDYTKTLLNVCDEMDDADKALNIGNKTLELSVFLIPNPDVTPKTKRNYFDSGYFSHAEVYIDTDMHDACLTPYVPGPNGSIISDYTDCNSLGRFHVGSLASPSVQISLEDRYEYPNWKCNATSWRETLCDDGFHVKFIPYNAFNCYEEYMETLYNNLAILMSDVAMKRLLMYQLKLLGISHIDNDSFIGFKIFEKFNQ